jgi:glycyl-tRNA synthetase
MRPLVSFRRNTSILQTFIPRFAARTFSTTPHYNRYQLPQPKKKTELNMATTTLKGQPFDRPVLDSMLRRRMFYTPSFEIYGGTAGL